MGLLLMLVKKLVLAAVVAAIVSFICNRAMDEGRGLSRLHLDLRELHRPPRESGESSNQTVDSEDAEREEEEEGFQEEEDPRRQKKREKREEDKRESTKARLRGIPEYQAFRMQRDRHAEDDEEERRDISRSQRRDQ